MPNMRGRYPITLDDRMYWEAIRARFRRRRIALGLRQQDVAERMQRSDDYVSVLENGVNIPSVRTVWVWAEALGLEMRFEPKADTAEQEDLPE